MLLHFREKPATQAFMDKSEVEDWLEREGRSKQWLARKFNVSYRTIGNWLNRSDRGLPERHIPRLRELMDFDLKEEQNIVIKVGNEVFKQIEAKAHSKGMTIYEYCENKIINDLL